MSGALLKVVRIPFLKMGKAPNLKTDGCEPSSGYWELNSGPLEEQAMLLTSEPSLQFPLVSKNYLG